MDTGKDSAAFSVRIFVPFGEAEGPRVIEKSNWIGRGVLFPRASLPMVTKSEQWLRAGVYVLWGAPTGDQLPSVYVGQSGDLKRRLPNHDSTKDWWTHCIAFASNRDLNQSQCRYIEASMWRLAAAAKRCELLNDQKPKVPSLPRADEVDLGVVGRRFEGAVCSRIAAIATD